MRGAEAPAELTRMERIAMAIARFTNDRRIPKALAQTWLRHVNYHWIRWAISERTYADRFDIVQNLAPDRGVVLAANHRSFFDMYTVMLAFYRHGVSWFDRIYFPVRSNFFYERPLGILVNLGIGAGSMYPPVFRDPAKADYTKAGVDRVVELLAEPGVVVGMHPEGTRGKGPDPYTMLRAQPGIGQMVLNARPIVIPLFINGLPTYDFVGGVRATHEPGARYNWPVIIAFGDPVDYSEFTESRPRVALYKQVADKIMAAVAACSERERALRVRIANRELDDGPGWLES